MDLVVDANIIFSALISSGGKTAELLFSDRLIIFAPEFLSEEFSKHKNEILSKSGLPKQDFELAKLLIFARVRFVPFSKFKQSLQEAQKTSPDENDTEYFALAISLGCPIWSNDKKLKEQGKVKVFSTSEMLKLV